MEEKENKEEIGLRPIIINYLLHWKLIIGTGTFAVILGILYLALYPKTYETVARVMIQDENDIMSSGGSFLGEAAGLMKSFGLGGASSGSVNIDDEKATFTSNSLMCEMIYELGLFAEYSEPFSFGYKLYEEKPITVTADSATMAQLDNTIECKLSVSQNSIKIKAKIKGKLNKTFQFTSFPATLNLEQGNFTFSQTESGMGKGSYKLNIDIRPLTAVADDLEEEILIEELSKSSNVIEFFVSDHEKQRSRDIFNTLIKLYNKRSKSYREELGGRSMAFLDGRINGLLYDLSEIENKIASYKTQNKITDVETDIKYYTEYMKDLQGKIIEAEAEGHIIKLLKDFIRDSANHYKLVPSLLSTAGSGSEKSPLTLYNSALLERDRIIKNSGADNPMIAPLTMQIEKLRESVAQMIDNEAQSNQLIISELKGKEKSIMSRMGNVPEQEKTYIDYRRQQEILQGVYLILLQKREETALTLGQSKEKAKVVDAAFTKPRPIAPRKLYAMLGVIAFTLIVTIGWLFCKEQYILLKNDFIRKKG